MPNDQEFPEPQPPNCETADLLGTMSDQQRVLPDRGGGVED
jgi:hypothetical protein